MKQKKFEEMVCIRWNKQMWEKVKKYCDKNGLEYSEFIRKATYNEMEG